MTDELQKKLGYQNPNIAHNSELLGISSRAEKDLILNALGDDLKLGELNPNDYALREIKGVIYIYPVDLV